MNVRAYTRPQFLLVAAAFLVMILIIFSQPIRNTYENIMFALDPSAARAAGYGDLHFRAQNPRTYALDRAKYWYEKTARLDSTYPYVNHQLARIEFLKANFNTALFYINREIELQGDAAPSSYYARALIEGYMGEYGAAIQDYEHFLTLDSLSWAGLNDYAWVLLMAGRFADAGRIAEQGLEYFPDNAWLLNTSAIAHFETGDLEIALVRAQAGVVASEKVTEEEWLGAYPGNNPRTASDGLQTLTTSARDNMHRIEQALASSTLQ